MFYLKIAGFNEFFLTMLFSKKYLACAIFFIKKMLIKKSKYLFIPTMLPYILKKKKKKVIIYTMLFFKKKKKTDPILFFQPLFLKCYFKKNQNIQDIIISGFLISFKKQKTKNGQLIKPEKIRGAC